ncbi:Putative uncharacterized protein, partial [Moritella viscosa]
MGGDGTITATITVPDDAVVGDILTYTVDGAAPISVELTDVNIATDISVEVVPGDMVTATVTDVAGNTSASVDAIAAGADLQADAGTITIATVASDDV